MILQTAEDLSFMVRQIYLNRPRSTKNNYLTQLCLLGAEEAPHIQHLVWVPAVKQLPVPAPGGLTYSNEGGRIRSKNHVSHDPRSIRRGTQIIKIENFAINSKLQIVEIGSRFDFKGKSVAEFNWVEKCRGIISQGQLISLICHVADVC